MNKRLVVVVETERTDAQGNKHPYTFTLPYGAPAEELFSVLNEIDADLKEYVQSIIDQKEADKTNETDTSVDSAG